MYAKSELPQNVLFGYRSTLTQSIMLTLICFATSNQIDLSAVLRTNSFYAYEDEDDLINEAAQYFARYLHNSWHVGSKTCGQAGILIFLSIEDRVCYISTGSLIESVVPWWRLESVVGDIKPILRRREYGDAILKAIEDIRLFLDEGPPTVKDRLSDFLKRFGLVIAFAIFTFVFALWGEYRDRFRRWQYTERRSKLTVSEQQKAKQLQKEYHCRSCPICLEEFPIVAQGGSGTNHMFMGLGSESKVADVSADPLPTIGNDGLPLKLLRCGHVFDQSCWKCWVDKGQGNPLKCPVCRQDIGGKNAKRRNTSTTSSSSHALVGVDADRSSTSTSLHSNYNSLDASLAGSGSGRMIRTRRGTANVNLNVPVRIFPLLSNPYSGMNMDRFSSSHLQMFQDSTNGENVSLLDPSHSNPSQSLTDEEPFLRRS
jgi:uncharacterized membrane protein YgcG